MNGNGRTTLPPETGMMQEEYCYLITTGWPGWLITGVMRGDPLV